MNALPRLHPEAQDESEELLRNIRRLFETYFVHEVWIFGSASRKFKAAPRDIDVAFICPPKHLPKIANVLAALFPSCRIERDGYKRTFKPPLPSGERFHFILTSLQTLSQMPRLCRSVKSGTCVMS
jgi:hypothetical protein